MVHVCLRRCEPSTTLIVAAFVGCVNDGESIYWAERKYANEVKETLRCPIWAFAKTMHLPQYWVHPLRRGHGGIPKWQLGTYPYLCLPVITGNIVSNITVLLQAKCRKAGTVGTPSVPRTTASSTVGTVGGTCAGARHVTHSSSLSCVSFRPSSLSAVVIPSSLSPRRLRCHPAVFAVICRLSSSSSHPWSARLVQAPRRCHPSVTYPSSAHLRCHLSPIPPSSPHASPVRRRRRRRKNVRCFRRCRHQPLSLPFTRRRRPSTAHAARRPCPSLPRIC